jgi:hypothetical protein
MNAQSAVCGYPFDAGMLLQRRTTALYRSLITTWEGRLDLGASLAHGW